MDGQEPVVKATFSGGASLGGIRRDHFDEIQAADGRFWLVPKDEYRELFAELETADEVYGVGDDDD